MAGATFAGICSISHTSVKTQNPDSRGFRLYFGSKLWIPIPCAEDRNKTCTNSRFCLVRVWTSTPAHDENPALHAGFAAGGELDGICGPSYTSIKSPNLDSLGMSWSFAFRTCSRLWSEHEGTSACLDLPKKRPRERDSRRAAASAFLFVHFEGT